MVPTRLTLAPSLPPSVRATDAKPKRGSGETAGYLGACTLIMISSAVLKQRSGSLAFISPKSEKPHGQRSQKSIDATEASMRYSFLAKNS